MLTSSAMRGAILIVLLCTSVAADDLGKLRKAAEAGDARAQNSIGIAYQWGQGVEKDYNEAVKWFRAAAKQNYASAQFNLGVSYLEGEGVEVDHRKATAWFTLAKENGDKSAEQALQRMVAEYEPDAVALGQAELGRMFIGGIDLPADAERGLKLLRVSASQGYAPAELFLCATLVRGEHVPADPNEGKQWCDRSAKRNFPGARSFLARELYSGEHLPQDRARAMALLNEVAGSTDPEAFYLLAKETTDPLEAEKLYILGSIYGSAHCTSAFKENRAKLSTEQMRSVVQLANKWLKKHSPFQRIDPKKLGL